MIIEHNEHPIERLMDNAFNKIRGVINADTIIGNPVTTADGVSIIPVSRVTMGFVTGGGEYGNEPKQSDYPFAGGSGTGVSVAPVGFLVSDGKSVKLIGVNDKTLYDKIIDIAPDIIKSFMVKNNEKKD
ncbi:MAG: GerW family sporulation protein [Clostridia bacterium]|nr:GerW family sporulation protein [Clostridia bacterium]